ncbi:DUF4253 domain-containing protein [Phytomonospora endophytica]|uniref:DUF4253 domain-containing protein n=1 Tax=Phytomonospora endophytica TaxID=714109 RepID=A0A841FTF2_9ACTN|nr:DUF4253 domain-containing protein [Phytomonospora endophytica]MBB6037018.1 hypothetical protein [Phytomonospora endophytica]GIG69438.1 hypothetical protein Pen01_57330 [Phytomonospora endophytica]
MHPSDHAALEAAGLAGRRVRSLDAAGDGTALLVEVTGEDMLGAWATARAAVAETGRWPVLCTDDEDDLFSRFYFEEGAHDGDPAPSAVLTRAGTIDVDSALHELHTRYPTVGVDWAEYERSVTLTRFGDAPTLDEVHAATAGAASARAAADRFLFAWELGREPLTDPGPGVQDWYGTEDSAVLVLLPTPEPWSAYAYVDALHDACGYGQDLLTAAARRWHERFGAEPVAALGVMTWLSVARPPAEPETAWRLAFEHHVLAENTFSGPGLSIRDHARALLGRDRWVLFSRP